METYLLSNDHVLVLSVDAGYRVRTRLKRKSTCKFKERQIKTGLIYWWLVESPFSGCFCLLARNFVKLVGAYG